MCSLKDCSVCECTDNEIPLGWRTPKREVDTGADEHTECSDSSEREVSASDPQPLLRYPLHPTSLLHGTLRKSHRHLSPSTATSTRPHSLRPRRPRWTAV